jgi:hypothetical protein
MKRAPLSLYYGLITALLLVQTVYTVYNQGLFINASESAHALKLEKHQLLQEQLSLQNELARATALSAVTTQLSLAEFQPMSKPLILTSSTTVALTR